MTKQRPRHINAPICPKCQKAMVYLYTDVKRGKSLWKCRDCNTQAVTTGFPEEEDEGDPSKQLKFVSTLNPACEYYYAKRDNYENRRTGENYLRIQDKQAEISGRGSRE